MINREFVLGVVCFLGAIWTLLGGKVLARPSGWVTVGEDFSFFLFTLSLLFLYKAVYKK